MNGHPSALILGDNIFFGHGLPDQLNTADQRTTGGTVSVYQLADPERHGVIGYNKQGVAESIVEKPDVPTSNYVVIDLYYSL